MTDVTVTEAIAYDCGFRAGHVARDAEVAALRAAITGWLEYLDSDDDGEPEQEHALLDAMRAALERRT